MLRTDAVGRRSRRGAGGRTSPADASGRRASAELAVAARAMRPAAAAVRCETPAHDRASTEPATDLTRPADLVLTGGRIATMDAARSWASALAVRDGRIVAVGPDAAVRALDRPADPGHRAARPDRDARASRTPTSIRSHGGLAMLRCDLHEDAQSGPGVRQDRRIRALPSGRSLDPWRGLVHGRLRGRHAPTRGPRPDRARPAGLPGEPRRPRRVGQHAGARARRGHRRDTSTRPTAGSNATRTAAPRGRCTRARWTSSARFMPDDTPADLEEALRLGQRHLHALGITAWQDAIVESDTEERAYVALASRGELTGRVVGAMWWEHHRGAEQIEEFVERRRADGHRPVRADEREADDGRRPRELHRRDARAVPRRPRRDDRQPRPAPDRSRGPRRPGSRRSTRSGSSRTSTRSATARCARRSTPSRRRGARTARPTRARTSPTSRSSIPTTSARFRELGVVANAQPLWAAHEAQMDVLTIPFIGGALALAVPVPLAPGRRRGPRDGLRLERLERQPAAGRWSSRSSAEPRPGTRASARSSCPTSASTSIDALAGVHDGLGVREPPRRRDRLARGRQVRRPRRPRPRPVRSRRPAPSARRASSGRSSKASPSTRTPRSTAERTSAPAWTDDDAGSAYRRRCLAEPGGAMLSLRTGTNRATERRGPRERLRDLRSQRAPRVPLDEAARNRDRQRRQAQPPSADRQRRSQSLRAHVATATYERARSSRSSKTTRTGADSSLSLELPPSQARRPPSPPAGVFVCPGRSGQVGRRRRCRRGSTPSGSSRAPLGLGDGRHRHERRQRPKPSLARREQVARPRWSRRARRAPSAAAAGRRRPRGRRHRRPSWPSAATSRAEDGRHERGHVAADDDHDVGRRSRPRPGGNARERAFERPLVVDDPDARSGPSAIRRRARRRR